MQKEGYMEDRFEIISMQKNQAIMELNECNKFTAAFGLTLSDTDIKLLVEERFEALKRNGRVEFGSGILKKLIFSFCDSSYILQDNFVDIIQELQDAFYYFKNESLDEFSDDELIEIMKNYFEKECQGSVEYLQESKLEDICRSKRYGVDTFDTENGLDDDYDNYDDYDDYDE